MSKERKTTELEQEVLEYLNILRDTGATNMYGARPYVMEQFELDRKESGEMLSLWMANYNMDGNYETVNS